MTRIKRGYTARKRRKRIFIGAQLTRITTQRRMRALVSSHRDRNRRKRDLHRLWITRINAVTCGDRDRVFYSYSRCIQNLYRGQLLLNRKILAQIALSNNNFFDMILNILNKIKNKNNK